MRDRERAGLPVCLPAWIGLSPACLPVCLPACLASTTQWKAVETWSGKKGRARQDAREESTAKNEHTKT